MTRLTRSAAGADEAPERTAGMRLFVAGAPLAPEAEFALPEAAARHALVRRVQPGAELRLFDGSGIDWPAVVLAIGQRGRVAVRLSASPRPAPAAELASRVTLAFGMPANERVDALVEKATELGAGALQPLMSERSVLRLHDERAERRRVHWQAVAVAACEQCGRATVPAVHAVRRLDEWLLSESPPLPALRLLLSTDPGAPLWPLIWPLIRPRPWPLVQPDTEAAGPGPIVLLSGPEGGFTAEEQRAACAAGFAPVSLGARVLRADTAPLAALAWIAIESGGARIWGGPTPKSG